MKKSNKTALVSAALALALSGAAFAQMQPPIEDPLMEPTPTAEVTFGQLDKNSDGYVSKPDVPADHELALQWSEADTDGDSRLSRAEFDAFENPIEEEESEE